MYANCISADEYHSSKRPLLQRLAVQGVEIEARDVVVAGPQKDPRETTEEEWSVIDLKDEQCLLSKEKSKSKTKSKQSSAMKQIKGAASVLSFVSPYKPGKIREEKSIFDISDSAFPSSTSSTKHEVGNLGEDPLWNIHLKGKESETRSILLPESMPPEPLKEPSGTKKAKRKPFRTLFHREQREGHGGGSDQVHGSNCEETGMKSAKKQWGFDGFKKWNKGDSEDETAPLHLNERSDSEENSWPSRLVASPLGEGPDTKLIKRKLHKDGSPSDFFIDKVSNP